MISSRKLIILFVFYLLSKIVTIDYKVLAQKDTCLSWDNMEQAYNEYEQKLKEKDSTPVNETEAPKTANELAVDKESIKRVPTNDGNPVQIYLTFYIDGINSISDVNMDFRLDFYYLQHWTVYKDDCTTYKNSLKGRHVPLDNVTAHNKLTIGKEYFTLFWLPDIMIANAKSMAQQSQIIDTVLLMIYFTNDEQEPCEMEYLARFESTVSCPMDFRDAPIDSQICNVQLRSFAFDMHKVNLSWKHKVVRNPDIRLLEHDLHIKESVTTSTLFNETYSTLIIKIMFDRKLANKMVGVYTPSILIVLITFCTFWLGLNSTSERVTIGITALLALVTQFNDVRQSLPPTSYISEMDKWMIMCMVFVSAQMVQCTLVDHVYHHQQHNQKLKEKAINVLKHFRRNSEQKQSLKLAVPNFRGQEYKNQVNPYERVLHNHKFNQRVMNNAFKKKNAVVINEPNSGCFMWITEVYWSLTSVPTSPDKPEYLPMKIDAYSRILFPVFFASICMFYWPMMLMKAT